MSELQQNLPDDDFWRKAFEEADETPPPRVWDAIERQLDESRGPRIIPLWGTGLASSRPLVWGAGIAAAIAVLLVGWWALNSQTSDQPIARVQRVKPTNETEHIATAPLGKTKSNNDQLNKPESAANTIASSAKPTERQASSAASQAQAADRVVPMTRPPHFGEAVAQNTVRNGRVADRNASGFPTARSFSSVSRQTGEPDLINSTENRTHAAPGSIPSADQLAVSKLTTNQTIKPGNVTVSAQSDLVIEPLNGKSIRLRDLGQIHRIVWFRPAELPVEAEATQSKREPRELWASVSMMPGSFNPSVSVRQPQTSFTNAFVANNANANPVSVNSRANFSVAYQAGAGIQLTDHWSIESGVGYLAGRSAVESPGQVAVASIQAAGANRNSPTSNLYVDAVRNSSQSNLSANAPKSSSFDYLAANSSYVAINSYDNRSQQVVTNNYQFVQVPVQIGYQFLPKSRLGVSLIGGLLTNIFVRNTVADEVVVTAKDGIYRPVSLAATMGARFRYRPSRRWSASLSGMYQPSLSSTTQSNAQIDSRPTSTGMSFGIDYHF
jgi:hypothetical protein